MNNDNLPVEGQIVSWMAAGRFTEANSLLSTLLAPERARLAAACRNVLAGIEGTVAPIMVVDYREDDQGGASWAERRNGPRGLPQGRFVQARPWAELDLFSPGTPR